jgi:peptide/nickel transport system permease protein
MFLPALTLALAEFPVYMRILRADMIATLQQDYILVARAKGLAVKDILIGHALRPSSLSLVTVVGINLGRLVGGAVIIETLFALPGIGQMLVNAVYQSDHFAIQGVVLVVAVSFIIINLAVDMIYALLDPRVRHGDDN